MKLNRRTTLIGLGTIVAGGGAALGTGAFDTVEADRSVDIETAGDEGALLGLEILSDRLAGDDNEDVIEFDLDDLNQNATTTFEDALEITNNGTETVDITIEDEGGEDLIGADGEPMWFNPESSSDEIEIGADDENQVTLDVEFDTTGDEEPAFPEQITISAETDDE
ncbi:uncharacterized protein Nmag_3745 (plasmid) [Natrialba magadii ATCC 43099]|nr:hypothetical protein [Natrialba magadii]ADD07287.1 uncharacterized protein Nmag_3745 [Natrialba magadii ATCC 43099]